MKEVFLFVLRLTYCTDYSFLVLRLVNFLSVTTVLTKFFLLRAVTYFVRQLFLFIPLFLFTGIKPHN